MSAPPILTGARVVLRLAVADDIPLFAAMFEGPSVARWWRTPPTSVDDDDEVVFAIEHEAVVSGLIQYGEENEPDYRSASIDIFIAESAQGAGLGSDAIRTLAKYLFETRGHHRITIDPAAANARAIACYEKVGFVSVGRMRQYERGVDGTWHDGLLMDLLRSELR